ARGKVAADANQVLLFHGGDPYRVHHPHPGGDDCVVLSVPEEDRRAWGEAWGDAEARAWDSALVSGRTAMAVHGLVADLRRGLDPAEVHERCLGLLAGVRPLPPSKPAPRESARNGREVAEAVKLTLVRRLSDPLRLKELAAEVGLSAFT